MSLIHPSVEEKEHSPPQRVSFSFPISESITKFFFLFVGLIFTLSKYELYFEELSSSVYLSHLQVILVYTSLEESKYLDKIHQKILHSKFHGASFLKI